MKKTTITMMALAVAGVAQMASAQIQPPNPASQSLTLENIVGGIVVGSATGTAQPGGIWSFNGTVGNYGITITSGQEIQAGSTPMLDMDVNVTTAGLGTLYIFFTDGAFGPTSGGHYTLGTSQFNSIGGGTASTWVYQGITLLGGGPDSTLNPVQNASGPLNGSNYYLTLEDVINGSISSADTTFTSSAVPEANTLVAGALMLLPLGIGAVRAIRKERVA